MRASGERLLWPAIALGAFSVRLLYILAIARAPVGIGGDAGFYHSAANLLAGGHFYYRGIFGHAYQTAEHPPLYSLLLSGGSLLGGHSLIAHRVISCAIGAVAVALIGLLGQRLGGRRTGIVAACLGAVYPPFVTADGLVMSEPLFTLAVAAVLLLALALRERPTVGRSVALGAAVAFAALTRGEGLLLFPFLVLPASGVRSTGGTRRLLAATVACALLLAPWLARNAVVFHRAIFATDANTLIAGANCPQTYYGHDIGWWSLDCLTRGRSRGALLTGDASTGAALRYTRAHLGRLPLVMGARVLRTFDFFQPLRQGNHELRARWVDLVGLCFYFPLLALAAFGLASAKGPRTRSLLLAPVWMVVLASALGWGIGRFRIGADVSIVVLAAVAMGRVAVTLAGRRAPSPAALRGLAR